LFCHIGSINVTDIQKRDTLLRDTTRVQPPYPLIGYLI
jgi:hypothetical protein